MVITLVFVTVVVRVAVVIFSPFPSSPTVYWFHVLQGRSPDLRLNAFTGLPDVSIRGIVGDRLPHTVAGAVVALGSGVRSTLSTFPFDPQALGALMGNLALSFVTGKRAWRQGGFRRDCRY